MNRDTISAECAHKVHSACIFEDCVCECHAPSILEDLANHPELTPLLDVNKDGEIECFGWISPVFDYPADDD